MPVAKDTITVDPQTVRWGDTVAAKATTSRTGTWLHAEVFQDETLVYAQYVRGPEGILTVGPTQAADETKPGSGRVEIGYWAKNGSYRATAVARFEVEP